MTNLEKEKIKELRNKGLGYKKISYLLGISLNTIKSFCRNNNLTRKDINVRCKSCNKTLKNKEKLRKDYFDQENVRKNGGIKIDRRIPKITKKKSMCLC